jgi:outer membrane protein TolC
MMTRPVAALVLFSAGAAFASAQAQDSPPPRELALSLRQAVDLATAPDGNTRVALAAELVEQARAQAGQSRAAFLPHIDGSVSQQSIVRNLEAFGIRLDSPPIPGFAFPSIVGPFDVFDARLTATQTIFDWSAIQRYRSAKLHSSAARQKENSTRDEVSAHVARAYVVMLRAQEQVDTARADVELAEALVKLAANRKDAGTGTGIEVTRAQVQLANERQKLLVRENERRSAQVQLSRLMGISLSTELRLTTPLQTPEPQTAEVEPALAEALENRADWKAQQQLEEALRRADGSVKSERLPSLSGFGDYGSIGSHVSSAVPTRTFGVALRVPIFDGGRREARRSESLSQLRQEEIRGHDLRQQIELELRLALDSLNSSYSQVAAAESGLSLAQQEQEQAGRRYEAGVGSSIEITDAQTRLARARQNRTDALVLYNLARIDWGEARGRIETVIP